MNYFSNIFGEIPKGIWPSEGSVSNDTLDIMCKLGIKWFASDERVLANSVSQSFKNVDKYFPRLYQGNNGEIVGFFRDHTLSDKIGFIYSSWNENDASTDFINYLLNVRNDIINAYGEDALDFAVVSIILDGENCWEFYPDNGIPFLRSLYLKLEKNDYLQTITFSEGMQNIKDRNFLKPINSIRAGSWINGNFNIWIGHEDDIKAWNMLSKARNEFENIKDDLDEEIIKQVNKVIMIAEGSDWFWWYGPEHHTDNKPEFDRLFRHYVSKIYELCGLTVPIELSVPIEAQTLIRGIIKPHAIINPNIETSPLSADWQNSGEIILSHTNSAMHQTPDILEKVKYGYSESNLFIGLKLLAYIEIFSLSLNLDDSFIRVSKINNRYELNTNIPCLSYYFCSEYMNFSLRTKDGYGFKKLIINVDRGESNYQYPDSGYFELI
jgi:alpha-amylase/alpha-mannosidase (GH57 family)